MTQSNVIFAAIFVAYLIFITMRGEIPIYLGLLLKSPPSNQGGTGAQAATGSSASSIGGQVASAAATIAPYAAAF